MKAYSSLHSPRNCPTKQAATNGAAYMVGPSNEQPKGRAKGGHARASKLTPERRSEIARRAGKARHWHGDASSPVLQATHGSPDHPLKIGEVEIPCYVLEDGTR